MHGSENSILQNQIADEEIASLVQHGDTESFGILVERYEAKMMRYARKFLFSKEDIEDLVQNVFIKAYTNIQGFHTKRRFSPWIYRIAHNEFINAIKKKKRQPLFFLDTDTIFPHPQALDAIDQKIHDNDLKNTLLHYLDRLDPKYREPIILFYFEELGYMDIAEVLHIPVSTVGVRIRRGKTILQKIFHTLGYHE